MKTPSMLFSDIQQRNNRRYSMSNNNNKKQYKPKPYQGSGKIYYLYLRNEFLPISSGTLKQCEKSIETGCYTRTFYAIDHRNTRPEFKR